MMRSGKQLGSARFAWVLALALWSCAPVHAGEKDRLPNPDDETQSLFVEPDARTSARIDELVAKLGVPEYKDRERATEDLIAIGLPAFTKLREQYRKCDDPEVRLRLERVVRTAFLDHFVYDRNGFLGIEQRLLVTENDDRVPKGNMWIAINRVIVGTAAEAAGVLAGDIIVAVDAQPIERIVSDQAVQAFGESIRVRGPGARVAFTLLRNDIELDIEVRLGRRPRELYGGTGQAITEMLDKSVARFETWWVKEFAPQPDEKPKE